jgi:large repetitive protein
MKKKKLLSKLHSIYSILNLTSVMNHLKTFQRAAVVVLAMVVGFSSRLSAQTCPVSNEITITVIPEATITAAGATIICSGGDATLTATPGGGTGSCTLQWQSSSDGISWTNISGATSPTLSITALTATMSYHAVYTCSGSGCDVVTSNSQTVTVNPDLSFTADLTNITQCIGGNSQLSVTTTGGSGGALTYTWEQSTNNSTWGAAASATNAPTYTPSSATDGTMYYRVRVSDAVSGCDERTSLTSTVVITPDLAISAVLNPITECIGGNDALTVTTSGGTGGSLTYTWEQSSNNSTWDPATGATNAASYIPPSTTQGTMSYRVRITDGASGCDAITAVATTVTITPDMTISAQLANITECIDGTDQLSITVAGGSGGAKVYTWQQSTNGTSGWAAALGASNAPTYTPPSTIDGTMYYRVNVTDAASDCGAVTSVVSTVIVTPDMTVSANLANITQCIDGTDQLSITVAGGSGGAKVYTWEESTNGTSGWTGAAGATNATTYTPSSATDGTMYYRVRISDAATGCATITSATSTVVTTPDMTVNAQLTNITECIGGTNALTFTVNGGSGGSKVYTWEQSTNGTTGWTGAVGATNATTYTPPSATDGTMYYRVRVSDAASGCGSITSATSTVVITPDLTISTDLVDISECIGGTTALTVATTGGSGGALTYTWEMSDDNITFEAATGASSTSATYTPASAPAGIKYYRVRVSDAASGCQSIPSAVSTVTINPDISISAQPAPVVECVSGTLPMSVTASGGVGTLTYQWEVSTDGGSTYTAVTTGGTSATYIAPSTAPGVTHYRVAISNAGNGCQSITSTATTVTVLDKPTISVAASVTTVCVGGGTLLTATPANGTGTCVIQWQNSTNGGSTWSDIPAANGTTYTTPALNSNTNYRAKYTCDGNGCCN